MAAVMRAARVGVCAVHRALQAGDGDLIESLANPRRSRCLSRMGTPRSELMISGWGVPCSAASPWLSRVRSPAPHISSLAVHLSHLPN